MAMFHEAFGVGKVQTVSVHLVHVGFAWVGWWELQHLGDASAHFPSIFLAQVHPTWFRTWTPQVSVLKLSAVL